MPFDDTIKFLIENQVDILPSDDNDDGMEDQLEIQKRDHVIKKLRYVLNRCDISVDDDEFDGGIKFFPKDGKGYIKTNNYEISGPGLRSLFHSSLLKDFRIRASKQDGYLRIYIDFEINPAIYGMKIT